MIDNLLQKYLKKIGVKEFSELSQEEKDTYRNWDNILTGRKLTDEDVAVFLNTELDEVTRKIPNPNHSEREDLFLKMKLEFILKIKGFLNTPETEKRILEQNINNLIK